MGDDYKVKPSSIILPKTSAYVKGHDDESKSMYFLIEDEQLLEKYIDIYNKVSKPICTFWKSKLKSYVDNNFNDKNMPKVGCNYICLVVILIDLALIKDENNYPLLLKEYK